MHLEDGRLLIPAERYDKLLKENGQEELDKWQLVRVSEDFRVVALGLPIPHYTGNPLDPPLRSRFQARDVRQISFGEHLKILQEIGPRLSSDTVGQLLSLGNTYYYISPSAILCINETFLIIFCFLHSAHSGH